MISINLLNKSLIFDNNYQAPPNQVKPEERQQAESVFMQFRGNKSLEVIQLCQSILGKSFCFHFYLIINCHLLSMYLQKPVKLIW